MLYFQTVIPRLISHFPPCLFPDYLLCPSLGRFPILVSTKSVSSQPDIHLPDSPLMELYLPLTKEVYAVLTNHNCGHCKVLSIHLFSSTYSRSGHRGSISSKVFGIFHGHVGLFQLAVCLRQSGYNLSTWSWPPRLPPVLTLTFLEK